MDINFYGQTEIFLDNFSAKFKYKIFHGHWPQHMANCPWPIDVYGQLSTKSTRPEKPNTYKKTG